MSQFINLLKKKINLYWKKLVQWTVSLAQHKTASYWLSFIAFIESSFFPLPADILFIPMVYNQRKKAYFYALIATISSILGTILGWAIGRFFFNEIALPLLQFYGKTEYFAHLQGHHDGMIFLLLITAGAIHLPPIKIVTILAGALNMNLNLFLIASILTRTARFFFLAWFARNYTLNDLKQLFAKMKWKFIILTITIMVAYFIYDKY